LKKYFPVRRASLRGPTEYLRAVDGVDLELSEGETLGLVGESGCGKTTLSRLVLGLIEPTAGTVEFEGKDITRVPHRTRKQLTREMQIVFQDPMGSLDPRKRVGSLIAEGLQAHGIGTKAERQDHTREMLTKVGLRPSAVDKYPHQFSGGQRQRIAIARALALNPKFVVADEPVSALDMSIQAQILNLLVELKDEFALTYLFVAHDLAVVSHISDRVAVMYLGRIVEIGPVEQVLRRPAHPYSRALMSAVLEPQVGRSRHRLVLTGDVPSPVHPPSGCRFRTRCPIAQPVCTELDPKLQSVETRHDVACHFPILDSVDHPGRSGI